MEQEVWKYIRNETICNYKTAEILAFAEMWMELQSSCSVKSVRRTNTENSTHLCNINSEYRQKKGTKSTEIITNAWQCKTKSIIK